MTSHRSGETESVYIADLVVALRTGQIKTGGRSLRSCPPSREPLKCLTDSLNPLKRLETSSAVPVRTGRQSSSAFSCCASSGLRRPSRAAADPACPLFCPASCSAFSSCSLYPAHCLSFLPTLPRASSAPPAFILIPSPSSTNQQYNRLLRIEEEISQSSGAPALYAGFKGFSKGLQAPALKSE